MTWTLPPEQQALLACARVKLREEDVSELCDALSRGIDWPRLVELAVWHKLEGLAHHHLRTAQFRQQVPANVIEELRRYSVFTVANNLTIRRELVTILKTLEREGIPAIVLKGAALNETVYTQRDLRRMADLDLLVPEERARAAQELVEKLGYRSSVSAEGLEDAMLNQRHLPRLSAPDKAAAVEIHRHIVRLDSPLKFDISGFWQRARRQDVADVSALILSPEDMIFHLAVNFFLDRRFHSAAALGQLTDIAEVIRRHESEIDWRVLLDAVRDRRMRGPVGCGLVLASRLLDAPVPAHVLTELWPSSASDPLLERFVARRVFSKDGFIAHELLKPQSHYHLPALAWAMFRRLVPSRSYMSSQYGRSADGVLGLRMYFVRVGEGVRMLFRGQARPGALKEDLSVDRWLHSLYERV